jgi:lipopolysaccharide assembly protein A
MRERWMRILMTVFYLFLVALGVSFAALNASKVQLDLYVTTLTLPVSVLMVVMLGLGILMGLLVFVRRYWRLKAECHKIKNQLRLTEKEIKNLRAIPLHNQH